MTTSDASWSPKFRKISELERPDHFHLGVDDICYFLGEYTARAGFGHSTTNQIIANLKKPVIAKGTNHWHYKLSAIRSCAATMRSGISESSRQNDLFVPIPPSKRPDDPEYDDRVELLAGLIAPGRVASLLRTSVSRPPRHQGDSRRDLDELRQSIEIAGAGPFAQPPRIFLVDDVLTTGCSFTTCKELLAPHFPHVPVIGIFVARRAIPPVVWPDIDIDL
jgi:hypothetical protein